MKVLPGILVVWACLACLAAPAQAPAQTQSREEGLARAQDDDLACLDTLIRTAVHNAAAGLGGLLHGLPDPAARRRLVQEFIEPIRFLADGSGYFFVYDYQCNCVAHAEQKDLVGRNLYDFRDTTGKYVIRELAAAAQQGGDFVDYLWPKPGAPGVHQKTGYVEPIPGTDWFIGAGAYLD